MADLGRSKTTIQRIQRFLLKPRAIIASGLVLAVATLSLCVATLYQGRQDALERACEASTDLGLLAERDIERNFELYDLALREAVDSMSRADIGALPPHLKRAIVFDAATTSARYVGSMLVLDAAGNIVLDSTGDVPRRANLADRMYFIAQRDNPHAGLYISDPYRSRLRGGELRIALSRRLSHPDGSFAGVVLVSMSLEYFRQLFAGLSLGHRGAISLIGRDGVMIMRQPYEPSVVGRNIANASTFRHFISSPEGTFADTSTIDGVHRVYYFRNFPNLPLIIMVARAEPEIYAPWRSRALTIGALTASLDIAFGILLCLLAVQLRQREAAEAELELLAKTDPLTGLNNRRTLDGTLAREWRRAQRAHNTFSVLFIDIDRFKAYNDIYGHQAGDTALQAVARCVAENIRRPADCAGRYGGEEFIVVLPDTTTSGAMQIAEAIRRAIRALRINHSGGECGYLTASIGVASSPADGKGGVVGVIHASDEALYRAKEAGRNRVCAEPAGTREPEFAADCPANSGVA